MRVSDGFPSFKILYVGKVPASASRSCSRKLAASGDSPSRTFSTAKLSGMFSTPSESLNAGEAPYSGPACGSLRRRAIKSPI